MSGKRRATLRQPILLWLLLLALSLMLLSVACADEPVPDGGIAGEVWIGPINPVEEPGQLNEKPYSADILVKSLPDAQIVARVTSDIEGRFRVALPPGRYLIEPQQGDPFPTAPSQEVTVTPAQWVEIRIGYDSGIR